MVERRAIKRIELNQPALVHVDGVRGVHPCLVMNIHRDGAKLHSSTHHTVANNFALSLGRSLKRGDIAGVLGGTEIPAVLDLSIEVVSLPAVLKKVTAR